MQEYATSLIDKNIKSRVCGSWGLGWMVSRGGVPFQLSYPAGLLSQVFFSKGKYHKSPKPGCCVPTANAIKPNYQKQGFVLRRKK